MTVTDNIFPNTSNKEVIETSNSWKTLYSSQLWSNSALREAILIKNAESAKYVPKLECEMIKDCCFCKTYRKYDLNDVRNEFFVPNIHSTPNRTIMNSNNEISSHSLKNITIEHNHENLMKKSTHSNNITATQENQCIPTISRQIDSSLRQKFSSSEIYCERNNNRRIRTCGMNRIGCIVSLSITDSSLKKRTQIQACSISIMLIAIVVVSFVLVNFTSPNHKTNTYSTAVVPTESSDNNITLIINDDAIVSETSTINIYYSTTLKTNSAEVTENISTVSAIIEKIRKNIRTVSKDLSKRNSSSTQKPKEINNRDLSQQFCKCQINEICMLDENSGTASCKKAIDLNDPTGNNHNFAFLTF